MEFINEWKERELKEYNQQFKKYCETFVDMYSKAKYHEAQEFKMSNKGFSQVFDKVMYLYRKNKNELNKANEEASEIFRKEIDSHFEALQAKVEKKIGKIQQIKAMSQNGCDYSFIGENGNCKIEVIFAGGYNIQRLHTRWIIK